MTLRAQDLTIKRNHEIILSIPDLTLKPGEVVAVLGPNGAGKSSLLQTLTGELAAHSGTIHLNDVLLTEWTHQQRAQMLAVLPQQSTINFPLSILEVVLLGRIPYNSTHAENIEIAKKCLQLVDITHDISRSYAQLSGGEQQRVQLGRIFAQLSAPESVARFLLLDEPISALDLQHQHMLLRLLRESVLHNQGALVILHDINLAMLYADRVLVLHDGKECANGAPNVVLTAQLIQEVFNIPATFLPHPQYPEKKIIVTMLT